jgi:biopolymer transport protein ExbD
MADVNTGRGSPRVDLTAMVDLGFLLITFFMFTTTLVKQKAMPIVKPYFEDIGDHAPIKKSRTLSILLGENDKVYWYVGSDDSDLNEIELDSTDFSDQGIRKVLLRRKQEVANLYAFESDTTKRDLVVLIKSMGTAKYRCMVSLMDEIIITDCKQYAIVEMDRIDSLIMRQVGQGFKSDTLQSTPQ